MFLRAQGISQAGRRTSRTKWLGLTFVGCPTRQKDHFERCHDTTRTVTKLILVVADRRCERIPPKAGFSTICHGVCLAHGAQVPHQHQRRFVGDLQVVTVGNRQGKTRPRNQVAEIPNVTHRRDARADPSFDPAFAVGQCSPQFEQSPSSEQYREKQPVGFQGPPCLDQLPDRIVRPVQRQRQYDQIMFVIIQRKILVVGYACASVGKTNPTPPIACSPSHDRRTEEVPVDRFQPVGNLFCGVFVKKPRRFRGLRCPGTLHCQFSHVEKRRRRSHTCPDSLEPSLGQFPEGIPTAT